MLTDIISRIVPASWLDKIAQERIDKQFGGGKWTTLLNTNTATSRLGNKDRQLEAYIGHVYKCVSVIKDRIQSLKWHLVYQRGNQDAEIDDHQFYELAARPNPVWTWRELLSFAQMHLDLCGRAFWRIEFNGLGGAPGAVWPLLPSKFSKLIVRKGTMEIEGYEFYVQDGMTQSSRKVIYSVEEIVDFRYSHPLDPFEGCSPIQQMAFTYDTDLAIRVYQRNFFQNSARPDLMFETDQPISQANADQFLARWNEKYQSVDQAWRPAVLGHGMKARVLNITNVDLMLIDLMNLTKQDILEAYRVPAGKLGTEVNVTKANSHAIDQTFNQECIFPRATLLSEVISRDILAFWDDSLVFKFENPVPKDKDFRLQERQTNLQYGYTSINEERERDGLEPAPWGQVPYLSITQVPVGSEMVPPTKETPKGITLKALKTDSGRARYWLLHNRRMLAYSKPLEKWLKRFFKDLRGEVNGNLSEQWKRYLYQVQGMSFAKARKWAQEHKEWETLNFDVEKAKERIRKEGLPFVEQIVLLAGENAFEFLEQLDLTFDIGNPRVLDFLATRENLLVGVVDEVFEQIRGQLAEGIEAAESVGQLQARINEHVWQNAEQVRSLRVARTESATATNLGNLEAFKQTGFVEKKEWLAAGDARETHLAAHARYQGEGAIPISEDFEVGAGRGPCPGSIGLPEEDINCRCAVVPVVRRE